MLKIDCEGCEYGIYQEFFKLFIRQILIEFHYSGSEAAEDSVLHDFAKNGYEIFHKEPNTAFSGGDCIEYGFIKMNLPLPPSVL